jgi:hypothetical protein
MSANSRLMESSSSRRNMKPRTRRDTATLGTKREKAKKKRAAPLTVGQPHSRPKVDAVQAC